MTIRAHLQAAVRAVAVMVIVMVVIALLDLLGRVLEDKKPKKDS